MEETAESTPEGTVDRTENSDEHTSQDGAPEVIEVIDFIDINKIQNMQKVYLIE